ncbi:MAG TPA: glycoside hydrolase family 3 N-terminal domain-containing protein [Burkholderiales bacterium]
MTRLTAAAALLAISTAIHAQEAPLYRQADAAVPQRVEDLLARMTQEEKIAQLEGGTTLPFGGTALPDLVKDGRLNEDMALKAIPNGVGTISMGAMAGFGKGALIEDAKARNLVQQWVLKNTRLGIPVMFHGEGLHGAAVPGGTSFPQAIGLGSTWDPALVRRMFAVVSAESRAAGNLVVLAPVLDLARDPRFGRVEEAFSEDPYLVSELGLAAVQGLQGPGGEIGPNSVAATAKHFVHGQPENGTNNAPNDVSERTMRNIFFPPFEKAVRIGHIATVMPSYNENDGGIPSHGNSWLLRDVLRKEWGFTGVTVSDYLGIERLHKVHAVAATEADAGVLAMNAGVDMELPGATSYPGLIDAVREGRVPQSYINDAVRRVLTLKFRLGLFERPLIDPMKAAAVIGARTNIPLARRVADESMVLLKNDGGLLPLNLAKIRSIAVIGPNADKVRLGTYSGLPPYFITVRQGIEKRVSTGTVVRYAEGVRISEPDQSALLNTILPYQAPSAEKDAELIAQAVEVARKADVVVLALGGNEAVSRESFGQEFGAGAKHLGDSDTLDLPGRQGDLIRAVQALGKPTVAVLLNGRPYAIEELSKSVPAIIEGWYLGQETGNAVAGAIFGDVNPSGKLPVTIARNVGQLPVYYNHTPAARMGYVFDSNKPLYPFGFGLSYTNFQYGTPSLDSNSIGAAGTATLSVAVTNSGPREGAEVVQMYVHPKYSSTVQPVKRLAGFERIQLKPGERRIVRFSIGPEQLAIWDRDMKRTVEPGTYELMVGTSSDQTTTIELSVIR